MSGARTRRQSEAAWLGVALCALAAYGLLLLPAQRRLAASVARTQDLYETAQRNADVLARAPGLTDVRDRVQRDLALLSGRRGPATATLATLVLLENLSARAGIAVVSVSPTAAQATADPAGVRQVTIAMRGRYRNVLAAIADLSRHRVLLEVAHVTLSAGANVRLDVDASVQAAIYDRPDALTAPPLPTQASLSALRYPGLAIGRDPFAPVIVPMLGASGEYPASLVLPPNAGAGDPGLGATRLRGIALGARPAALVDVSGRIVVVGIGSSLLGSTVVAIRRDFVLLQDGEEIRFMEKRP